MIRAVPGPRVGARRRRPDGGARGVAMFPDVPTDGLPLSGLKVIDCTIYQQGPYSTVMLADFGADVIKVEGPDSPDPGRALALGPRPGEFHGYFEAHNRNKR